MNIAESLIDRRLQESSPINNPDYEFYCVKGGKILSGWEYQSDAKDWVKEQDDSSIKVYTLKTCQKMQLDPHDNSSWGTDGLSLAESSNYEELSKLQSKIEDYYGRKLEASQIMVLNGKDDKIAALLSKYRKLSRMQESTVDSMNTKDLITFHLSSLEGANLDEKKKTLYTLAQKLVKRGALPKKYDDENFYLMNYRKILKSELLQESLQEANTSVLVGTTRTGKKINAHDACRGHKDFSADDHKDAAQVHTQLASISGGDTKDHHTKQAKNHLRMSSVKSDKEIITSPMAESLIDSKLQSGIITEDKLKEYGSLDYTIEVDTRSMSKVAAYYEDAYRTDRTINQHDSSTYTAKTREDAEDFIAKCIQYCDVPKGDMELSED